MVKIIKTIFIIVISVASSTATTVVLIFRYTKPLENSTAASQPAYPEQHSVASMEKIVDNLIPRQEQDVETPESAQFQAETPRYFDYALLSKDMAAFSETVGRFNEILSREIQKLRKGASSGENTSP